MNKGAFYYSPSSGGFYNSEVNDAIASDSVEITRDKYHYLLGQQSAGKVIGMVDGEVNAIDQTESRDHRSPYVMREIALNRMTYDIQRGDTTYKIQVPVAEEYKFRYAIQLLEEDDSLTTLKWRDIDRNLLDLTVQELRDAVEYAKREGLAIWLRYNTQEVIDKQEELGR